MASEAFTDLRWEVTLWGFQARTEGDADDKLKQVPTAPNLMLLSLRLVILLKYAQILCAFIALFQMVTYSAD